MQKRKRPDDQRHRAAAHGGKRPRPSQPTIEDHINAGLKDLTRALKQAKGFERQRLGKRLKEASKGDDGAAVERINAEVAALKSLESRADLAQNHLYKVLLRTKSIRESDRLPPFVRTPAKRDDDATTANVISRLFRAKAANKAVAETLERVKQAMGLGTADNTARASTKVGRTKHTIDSDPSLSEEDATVDAVVRHTGSDDGSDDDFEGFDDRIASSTEDDEDGGTDDDADQRAGYPVPRNNGRVVYKPSSQSPSPPPSSSPSVNLSSDSPGSASPSPAPESHAVRRVSQRDPKQTFLPALTMGGYLSNSDSEAEDLDALAPPRKNKRGQRARQQIWEKKYGDKAKHLQNASKDRNVGWDPRYGARSAGEKRKPGQPWKKEKLPTLASGPNEIAVKPRKPAKKKSDDLPLHPSWQAKKLAKEKQQMQNIAFAGKKITFD